MPYNFPFERIAELSNESAFEQNKSVAAELIAAFPEIHDLNDANSSAHFMHRELDLEDEFPDKHFSLYADIGNMGFSFQFWKDVLWLELGAAGDSDTRFAQVRRYAAFIMQQGFKLNPSLAGEIVTLDEWVGFVEQVVELVNTRPSAT
jgi:hypothetical protein